MLGACVGLCSPVIMLLMMRQTCHEHLIDVI